VIAIGCGRRLVVVVFSLCIAALACSRGQVVVPSESTDEAPEIVVQETASIAPNDPMKPTPFDTIPATQLRQTSTPSRPTPAASPTFPPTPTLELHAEVENLLYETQPGDTLWNLAIRFGVIPSDIRPVEGRLPEVHDLISPGITLIIPNRIEETSPSERLVPDSEIAFSPHAAEFDITSFVELQDGYLNSYREIVRGRQRSGAEVIALAALDHSMNPRMLLALVEYYCGWVSDPSVPSGDELLYPLGIADPDYRGLYRQLTWLSNELGKGYYGWRAGSLIELTRPDGTSIRLAPGLNAGTVALQYIFAQKPRNGWEQDLGPDGFIAVYMRLFGDPWAYWHPLYEPNLQQPPLILPFLPGHVWSFTGGPHGAWEREAAWAALDFAPSSMQSGCVPSDEWIVASAAGLVTRSENGLVVLDLDGDGLEQTGWVILYLHIATKDRITAGSFVEQGDLIGHPSCEGGYATGTHVHMARKYNGEWILADGPLPFELSGWVAHAGTQPYEGSLTRGDQIVLACTCSTKETLISR
jgi:LasA protease